MSIRDLANLISKRNEIYFEISKIIGRPAEKITAPYNRLMDEARCQELIPKIKETIKNYDAVVFFKAGSRKLYEQCIAKACEESGVRLISFGHGFMAGINDLSKKLEEAGKGV